ncbi:hypothetical protein Agub_g12119, partial [Astrephomene gubernaculifera]
ADRPAPTRVQGPLAAPAPAPGGPRRVAAVACGWRHTLAVTAGGEVFSWGRGVNGQLGQGSEQDLHEPTLLAALSRGVLRRADILSTAAPPAGWEEGEGRAGYVAPADRYAVVPGADEPLLYGNGGSLGAVVAAAAAVPSMPMVPPLLPEVQQQQQGAG